MKKLLLHVCCGPCASPIIPNLIPEFNIDGYFYNPNIHPQGEFEERLNSAKKIANFNGVKLIVPEQSQDQYLKFIGDEWAKPERCLRCYELRLGETARYAKENGYNIFSTTLLISPFQHHKELKKIGENVGKHYGVDFYYRDFRPLYKESRELAANLELYLQKYCGCKFSRRRK